MRKVLIIGPDFFDYNQSIERAFINLGFETKVIGYTPGQVRSLKEKFQYHITRDKDIFFNKIKKEFNQDVSDLYNSFKPDLLFLIQGNYIFKSTVEMMKCKKVLWMMDSIFRAEEAWQIRNSVDFIFVFEKTDVDKLWQSEKITARFLPLALDETVYFPTNKNRDIDILFVGALYENRIRLLKKIINRFPLKSIKIYGSYYSPFRRPFHHLFRRDKKSFLNKNISPQKVNEVYNRSRICVNIHHSQSQYGVNQRFFEISGSRSFQLVDNNPYIRDNFSAEEITIYHSEQDLFDKIEFFLEDHVSAGRVAEKAYEKILSQHTFTYRIKGVLEIIGG
jgi:spore maturation protein CgeB